MDCVADQLFKNQEGDLRQYLNLLKVKEELLKAGYSRF